VGRNLQFTVEFWVQKADGTTERACYILKPAKNHSLKGAHECRYRNEYKREKRGQSLYRLKRNEDGIIATQFGACSVFRHFVTRSAWLHPTMDLRPWPNNAMPSAFGRRLLDGDIWVTAIEKIAIEKIAIEKTARVACNIAAAN